MESPKEQSCHGGDTSLSKGSDSSKHESQNKEDPATSPARTASPISDDTCSICLGNITDKCMANSCHHSFCLVCLKEWSKQKAVCPLCKLSFTKIIYDIKSDDDFKEWKVPRFEQAQPISDYFQAYFVPDRRFFGYRTTNFPGATNLRRPSSGNMMHVADAIPSGPRETRASSFNMRGSSFFRRNIYLNNEWVEPIADITGRYRQSSPELYREQPGLTHRLVPWVNRELAALIHSSRIGVVLAEIMDLIERYPINSRDFRRAVRPHLGSRTNHFVHEFYYFARSPYDMVGHDNAARYVRFNGDNDDSTSESSTSEDSDAIVEVDVQGNPVSSTNNRVQWGSAPVPANVEREETLTQEGSVLISSDESSTTETPQQLNLFAQSSASPSNEAHDAVTSIMSQLMGRARSFLNSVNEGASTSISEGNVAHGNNVTNTMKREAASGSDDSDFCVVIEEVNKNVRTPEIVTLDSDEEDRPNSSRDKKSEKNSHKSKEECKRGSDSHSQKGRKGKKKPSLNRSNFPIPLHQAGLITSSRVSNRDHSYCNMTESEVYGCSVRDRVDQPSSSEDMMQNYGTRKALNIDKTITVSSDCESSSHNQQRKRKRHKEKRTNSRDRVNTQRHVDRSRRDGCGSSSWHDTDSTRESSSPMKRRRKDHKSKVKNSQSHLWLPLQNKARHSCLSASGTSSNSRCNSDNTWTPSSSSMRERSSSRDGRDGQDGSLSECSSSSGSVHYKDKKCDSGGSKSKHYNRRGKHKKKDKYKEQSKKNKRRKHKKRSKSRRSISSSSSDLVSDSSERVIRRKRKRRISESSSSAFSSPENNRKKKTRQIIYSESNSSSE